MPARSAREALRLALVAVVAVALTTGCLAIQPETKERIAAPVDCSSAEADIQYLEDERSGGFHRTLSVVTGLFPLSAIVLIARGLFNSPDGAWTDKFRVGFGSYNDKIDDKIAQTKSQCGIQTGWLWGYW